MRHAMIIGGSVAGLCAARALSEFFERVTVLERDSYPTDATDRPGVPHGATSIICGSEGSSSWKISFRAFSI